MQIGTALVADQTEVRVVAETYAVLVHSDEWFAVSFYRIIVGTYSYSEVFNQDSSECLPGMEPFRCSTLSKWAR